MADQNRLTGSCSRLCGRGSSHLGDRHSTRSDGTPEIWFGGLSGVRTNSPRFGLSPSQLPTVSELCRARSDICLPNRPLASISGVLLGCGPRRIAVKHVISASSVRIRHGEAQGEETRHAHQNRHCYPPSKATSRLPACGRQWCARDHHCRPSLPPMDACRGTRLQHGRLRFQRRVSERRR